MLHCLLQQRQQQPVFLRKLYEKESRIFLKVPHHQSRFGSGTRRDELGLGVETTQQVSSW